MAKYDHIDFTPPDGVREEAQKGLDWREEYKRGGTAVGVARARDLSNGKSISPDTAKRMRSYFARHEVDKKGKGWSPGDEGFPSAGRIAWALWGGDPGEAWSNKLVKQIEAADKSERSMNKKGKLRPVKSQQLVMRSMIVRSDESMDGVRVITATENPVDRFDEYRGIVVKEVLAMDGIELRNGSTQIPIVDSHDESSVRNIFGSLRNLQVIDDEFGGDAYFASDPDSQAAMQKLRDGHLTDFSITAIPKEIVEVPAGESYTTTMGTSVDGPANIVVKWVPINASLVATGADERSTVRRSYLDLNQREVIVMDEMLLMQLQAMGMPAEMTDPNEILAWVVKKLGSVESESMESEIEQATDEAKIEMMLREMTPDEKRAEDQPDMQRAESEDEMQRAKNVQAAIRRALAKDQERRKEIQNTCQLAHIERAFADQLCDSNVPISEARKLIMERMMNKPLGSSSNVESVRVTGSQDDKFYDAVRDGLVSRALRNARVSRNNPHVPSDSNGSAEFARLGMLRLAETVLRYHGAKTDRMTNREIAQAAMGNDRVCRAYGIQRSAYHTTGSFPNLLLDAANKTLLAQYEETPVTYEAWARTAAPVADFKAINRIRFSESPEPELVPETKPYPEKAMSDSKESYYVEKYGAKFSVSWETIVNDDLDAISRIPAMHGAACRRLQNKKVYEVLTSNPLMGDAIALFNASHSNFANASASPSTTTLDQVFVAMMTQKGLNGTTIIRVAPKFLIAPAALGGTVHQLLASLAPPSVGGDTTGNSNVANIYGPGGDRPLVPIIEPELDAYSSTAWFVAADNSSIDTVEISFLEGEESPVLESEWDFDTDTYKYKVRQTFGVKAIDWRGLYKYHNA